MNYQPAKLFSTYLQHLGCKKKKVRVIASSKILLINLNWCGGTRATYTVFTLLGTLVSNTEHYSVLAPWNNPAEGVSVPLPEGFIVIQTGFFCGKEATPYVYVNPADMPKLLESNQ